MSKNKFTGTATQPQCNRKFCQFNKDQYCMLKILLECHVLTAVFLSLYSFHEAQATKV